MSYLIDIGGAPANEDCAQLGQTPDFEAVNTFEVLAYKLAIIARHGMPPAGCKLGLHTNRHDFGVYRTLALHIEDEEDEAVQAYAEAVEEVWVLGSRPDLRPRSSTPVRSPRSNASTTSSW